MVSYLTAMQEIAVEDCVMSGAVGNWAREHPGPRAAPGKACSRNALKSILELISGNETVEYHTVWSSAYELLAAGVPSSDWGTAVQ